MDQAAALIDRGGSWELIATHGTGMVRNLLKGFDENSMRFPRLQLCRVALLIKEGHLQSAEQLLERVRIATDNFGRMNRALNDLRAALAIAAPQKMRRAFLDRRQPLAVLLKNAINEWPERNDGHTKAFARELRELMLAGAATCAGELPQGSISERELEVLILLSRGHSNKTIAHMLGTSENTIKFHLKNIYTKLQVDKWRLAVEVAKRRAIIE